MTTPNLPEAAIAAAAEVLTILYGHADLGPVEAALAAALPHLGETGTEYGAQSINPETGQTMLLFDSRDRDHIDAVLAEVKPEWAPQLVQRTVIYGQWRRHP